MDNIINSLLLMNEPKPWEAPLTYLLLAITVYTSYKYMEESSDKRKLMFNAAAIHKYKHYYRFFSHGLIHGDWIHLLFNSYVLFEFGTQVEMAFGVYFGLLLGPWIYLLLYATALPMSSLYSFQKHKFNASYNALGASGAVSAIVFAFILLGPTVPMYLIFIPIPVPAYVLGLLYLAYSVYMSKKGMDNVGHDAHYWGAIWGFVFPIALQPSLFMNFIEKIRYSIGL